MMSVGRIFPYAYIRKISAFKDLNSAMKSGLHKFVGYKVCKLFSSANKPTGVLSSFLFLSFLTSCVTTALTECLLESR